MEGKGMVGIGGERRDCEWEGNDGVMGGSGGSVRGREEKDGGVWGSGGRE